MKKFLLLWVVLCLGVLIIPKLVERLSPKIVYKEVPVYRVKKEIQYVEKEVFKGEKIVEKVVEKIVYKDAPMINAHPMYFPYNYAKADSVSPHSKCYTTIPMNQVASASVVYIDLGNK